MLLALLALCGCLNYPLFLCIAPPVLCLALPPMVASLGRLGWAGALGAAALSLRPASISEATRVVAPWVPTPADDVLELLRLAGARPGQVFLELGSGDGRNLVRAAGAGLRAVGLEVSPLLVAVARLRGALSGCRDRVTVRRADVLAAALPRADLVFTYLSAEMMASVAPRLSCAYGRRARVQLLSRDFAVPGWTPRRRVTHGRTALYVYAVPPPARGSRCD